MDVWDEFFSDRTKPIDERFPGQYRSLVVETNDPLNMNRIRFKCPELHDFDLSKEDCPWAVPAFDLGGYKAGRFVNPIIGDWVWIAFEKQHPYGPIWTGFANPTRAAYYSLPQISIPTSPTLNKKGQVLAAPNDFDVNYLPKDGRPMCHGWVDSYGNMDLHSSVGYFPKSHDVLPPPPDHDALADEKFRQSVQKPLVNDPDKKYMARVTKYGHIFIMGDQGYHWKKDDSSDVGEFTGDKLVDEEYETQRWLYLQRLLNDDIPSAKDENGDQRKILLMTRYGSRIEMRDSGWAQEGPIPSTSRENEFGPSRKLSKETSSDHRWIKIRTKGGMLFQAYDKGFDPASDKFINRPLLDESGVKSEKEDEYWGGEKDARWIRICTRYGLKFVMDDRGSDQANADEQELPRGVGILLKGRRTPGSKIQQSTGDPRGFMWEFNENDQANHTMWSSPLGQSIEINDRYQYTMIAVSMGKDWVPQYQGLKENEFIRKPLMLNNPEESSHHIKLDHDNEYIRMKTRANKGPSPDNPANVSGVDSFELQQGFEARDGSNGDGPWVEVVDCQNRGLWFSKRYQLGVWRSRSDKRMFQWFEDNTNKIVIYNNEITGKIEIFANQDINIISNNNININAGADILMKAAGNIKMQAGESKLTLFPTSIRASQQIAPSGADPVTAVDDPILPDTLTPKDRGASYNGPFEECPIEEVEHLIRNSSTNDN